MEGWKEQKKNKAKYRQHISLRLTSSTLTSPCYLPLFSGLETFDKTILGTVGRALVFLVKGEKDLEINVEN